MLSNVFIKEKEKTTVGVFGRGLRRPENYIMLAFGPELRPRGTFESFC